MKRTLIPSVPLVLITISSLLSPACKKEDHHPDGHPQCSIQQLKGDLGFALSDSAVFVYNAKGDPVSITRTIPTTGHPNYLFYYDAHRRLTDYIGVYSDGVHFEFRRRYGYDSKNRIVQDTLFTFGALTDPPQQWYVELITTYTYDARNRIIRQDDQHPRTGGRYIMRYVYNEEGNLEKVYNGNSVIFTYTYDNKVNLHRTHPVWQFIDRDFSVNNPFQAITYNKRGLPLKVESDPTKFDKYFLGIAYHQLEVSYSCR
ncbi:hypothetical protein [uncultured Chitinophaga sp.]|jgi:hypothetical protein|uniref:hypothetical protein n=1 Tax=uncultured Chitinophaga sp. TaxID=339340 RepID=UPI0026360847|nr:hypothetical protein [uncultured Chitinophaga sp.]